MNAHTLATRLLSMLNSAGNLHCSRILFLSDDCFFRPMAKGRPQNRAPL